MTPQTAPQLSPSEGTQRIRTPRSAPLFPRQAAYAFGQLMDFKFYPIPPWKVPVSDVVTILELEQAVLAIEIKRAELSMPGFGPHPGNPTSDVEAVPGGFMQHFQNCDIYYSSKTGVHEVHGEIKAKYDALLGAFGKLGLPITDELSNGDPIGRYNDFVSGSIVWTAHTGPMTMMNPIRDFWRANGAQGVFGYPVYDQHRVAWTPDPHVEWCGFENGNIVQAPDGVLAALAAEITPADLRKVVRAKIDTEFHKTGDNVGLHPNVETEAVGTWSHGFWASVPRDITFALHGFHDNGALPDTNFKITLGLRFELVWTAAFTEATDKTLVATLTFLRVTHESGADDFIPVVPGQVVSGVANGIYKAFFPDTPDAAHPEIPAGSIFVADVPTIKGPTPDPDVVDVVDVLVTAAGGLQVLVDPLPAGPPVNWGLLRKNVAQNTLDGMVPA